MPALQPVATRLHELDVFGSSLQGSADDFLTEGWTALTSLSLTHTHLHDAALTATLKLQRCRHERVLVHGATRWGLQVNQ